MPRESQRRTNTQPQFKEQDTFRYSTPDMKVVAQSRDPYITPVESWFYRHYNLPRQQQHSLQQAQRTQAARESLSDKTKGVLSVLGEVQGVADFLVQEKERREAEGYEQGKLDAATEQVQSDKYDKNMGYLRAVEEHRGAKASVDYAMWLEEFMLQNPDLTVEELNTAAEQKMIELAEGRTKFFGSQFMPNARSVINKKLMEQTQVIYDQLQVENTENLRAEIDYTLKNAVESGATPEEIRTMATRFQEAAIGLFPNKDRAGIRKLVTEEFVQTLGRQAMAAGRPDLLAVYTTPDENGVTFMHTDARDEAEHYMKAAEKARVAREKAVMDAESKYLDDTRETLYNIFYAEAHANKPEHERMANIRLWADKVRTALHEHAGEDGDIYVTIDGQNLKVRRTDIDNIFKEYEDLMSIVANSSFSKIPMSTDQYENKKALARTGDLNVKDMARLKASLTADQYAELNKLVTDYKVTRQDRKQKRRWDYAKTALSSRKDMLEKKTEFDITIREQMPIITQELEGIYNRKMDEFDDANDGGPPTYDQIEELNTALDAVVNKYASKSSNPLGVGTSPSSSSFKQQESLSQTPSDYEFTPTTEKDNRGVYGAQSGEDIINIFQ